MNNSFYVGPDEVMAVWEVDRATAQAIIIRLNEHLLTEYPEAIVIPGKVNKLWFEAACALRHLPTSPESERTMWSK